MGEVRITAPLHSHLGATAGLLDRGLKIATAIDIGCADRDFLLLLNCVRGTGDVAFFNIDANPLYEDSPREIEAVIGAGYHIGPLTTRTWSTRPGIARRSWNGTGGSWTCCAPSADGSAPTTDDRPGRDPHFGSLMA